MSFPHGTLRKYSFPNIIPAAMFIVFFTLYAIFKSGLDWTILRHAFSENAGIRESLPQVVQDLRFLVNESDLVCFSLEGGLSRKGSDLLHQRSIEFLYPVRWQAEAGDRFMLDTDESMQPCERRGQKGAVVHYVYRQ